jgi:LysM repeat protein
MKQMMKKQLMLFSIIALFAFCCNGLAQEMPVETAEADENLTEEGLREVKEVITAEVLDHKVAPGETIVIISKKYLLQPQDIYEFNPKAVAGLAADMVLKLPAEKIKAKLKPEQQSSIRQEQVEIIKKYD